MGLKSIGEGDRRLAVGPTWRAALLGLAISLLTLDASAAPSRAQQEAPAEAGQLVAIIYFGHGSARLNDHDQAVLRAVAALHRERGAGILVIGHASARTGTATPERHRRTNQALGPDMRVISDVDHPMNHPNKRPRAQPISAARPPLNYA